MISRVKFLNVSLDMYPSCNLNIILLRVELIDVVEKDRSAERKFD